MYVNKCIKCGAEFETKNPKRVICPNCLYSDKKYTEELSNEAANAGVKNSDQGNSETTTGKSYSFGSDNQREERKYRSYDRQDRTDRPQYNRGYNNRYNNNDRYNNDRPRDNRNQQGGGYQRPNNNNRFRNDRNGQRQRPGYSNNKPGGFNRVPRPNAQRKPQRQKQLLVSKEQIEQIEILYKKALPLPNPDIHEVIGQAIELEPRKVFFGINLVRQKMMLPKLPFPKRKLAVSPDQLFAIKSLYEPLLPLPPIGCHKIIAAQLRMDEWRVHVGIGLIRKQMGLDRWNQERDDAPEEYKKTK
ncbi:MAG: hypothetical protein LUG16_08070 [Candidatus Gastranaerophilales bacterium]|nr:hypothetical protein [Candidatus Gastranaerophilales bacterium]